MFISILENEGASDEIFDRINFGTSTTFYIPRVSDFYGYFGAFSTNLSFSRSDKWDLRYATNRKERRLLEKENSKARELAKREYSERIRELALFVRKRDPRVVQYQQEEAQRALEKQQLLQEMKLERQRALAAAVAEYVEPEWAQVDRHETDHESGEEEEDLFLFECVACDKQFKSEKQASFASECED